MYSLLFYYKYTNELKSTLTNEIMFWVIFHTDAGTTMNECLKRPIQLMNWINFVEECKYLHDYHRELWLVKKWLKYYHICQ